MKGVQHPLALPQYDFLRLGNNPEIVQGGEAMGSIRADGDGGEASLLAHVAIQAGRQIIRQQGRIDRRGQKTGDAREAARPTKGREDAEQRPAALARVDIGDELLAAEVSADIAHAQGETRALSLKAPARPREQAFPVELHFRFVPAHSAAFAADQNDRRRLAPEAPSHVRSFHGGKLPEPRAEQKRMITVDDALERIGAELTPCSAERRPLAECAGRTLSADARAMVTHPPGDVSAMDGYAVHWTGPIRSGARFNVIGEARAGAPFAAPVGEGAVRIFTGGVVPPGANHIIIQEHAARTLDEIALTEDQPAPRHIRPAGGDFFKGDVLAAADHRLRPVDLALLAAAGVAEVNVRRRPTVAVFSNGDELVAPGQDLQAGQVYDSIWPGLSPMTEGWGAKTRFLGRASDTVEAVDAMLDAGAGADLLLAIGGASVGDYDVVRTAASKRFDMVFDRVAMKPGKPVWFAKRENQALLGFPGNPGSAFVCAQLFLRPAIEILSGARRPEQPPTAKAELAHELGANGPREHFLRAMTSMSPEGRLVCAVHDLQDASLLSPLAQSNALVRRAPGAPELKAGALVDVVALDR